MSPSRPTARLESAGGVVYREGPDGTEVVLCGRTSQSLWALPKGTPEAGETREQTALREVSEETGLEVVIREYIGDIEYWFFLPGGERCHKTVYYYLMTQTGGDMSRHDSEFDDVRWFSAPDALETMTHQNEVQVVEKGLSMVAEQT
jgi:8-oxo-dGTP pyrophosphatase MutT (NUDIX family)